MTGNLEISYTTANQMTEKLSRDAMQPIGIFARLASVAKKEIILESVFQKKNQYYSFLHLGLFLTSNSVIFQTAWLRFDKMQFRKNFDFA